MADTKTEVHIGENSPEGVAFKLYQEILSVEGRTLGPNILNRKWILDAYAECLRTIKAPYDRLK
jgi:hypothetical protein